MSKLARGCHSRESARERQRQTAHLEFKLADQRDNLAIIRHNRDSRMYGEGLIEYARLLGEWEALLTC